MKYTSSVRLSCVWMTLAIMVSSAVQAAPLREFKNCTFVKTDWADGDSFQVQIPFKSADKEGPGHKAEKIVIRLYGADCIEAKTPKKADVTRLREQRRYFGITKLADSVIVAKGFGVSATAETARMLDKPFTIYTSKADARGDPKSKRVFAFVTTADGKDLASWLVSQGLARAHGVARETFDKRHRDDYKADLLDLELQAAKNDVGVWKHTDWKSLPEERRAQRDEDREIERAIDGKKQPPAEKVHVNKAARDELMKIPGIGGAMADRIIESRPYRKPEDLLKVSRIGAKTLEKLKLYLEFPVE